MQKTDAPNEKTGVIAFFAEPKIMKDGNYMFSNPNNFWHGICLITDDAFRSTRMQVANWFEHFREQRTVPTDPIAREVDIPGVGKLILVRSVDCLGAMCPRPQLLTLKVLGEIEPGEVIEVLSDNPAAVEGFPALAQTLNSTHLATVRDADRWRMYLRKGL
ncbi:MAG: sulfurtransferase TusA family protein [Thiobacillus sp.]|nr:sulfurtransferase TusA family protein [Thiobacillus sp.]